MQKSIPNHYQVIPAYTTPQKPPGMVVETVINSKGMMTSLMANRAFINADYGLVTYWCIRGIMTKFYKIYQARKLKNKRAVIWYTISLICFSMVFISIAIFFFL
jgi:hypothetical protein